MKVWSANLAAGDKIAPNHNSALALNSRWRVTLSYQGKKFVQRFDANSYLYVTRAMDYYDAAARWGGGDLVEACQHSQARTMIVSFSSDWLYTPDECRELAQALCQTGRRATYVDIPSRYGRAFLIEIDHLVGLFIRSLTVLVHYRR